MQRMGGRHQTFCRQPHHEPLAYLGKTDDVEHDETAILDLRGNGVCGDEGNPEISHHGLLDRLVRADFHADARLDVVAGHKVLGDQSSS
jgi:hypothetical protein